MNATPINGVLERRDYAERYGPTKGDRIVLADTEIVIEIESDATFYGDELTVNFGGSMRAGLGQTYKQYTSTEVDTVIANAVIFDANKIIKADIGIKNGLITGVGKAGNPEIMHGVDIIVGCHTTVIDAAGMIITPGSVLTNARLESSGLLTSLVNAGVTTVIGGAGTSEIASTSGAFNTLRFLDAMDGAPLNFVLTGNLCTAEYQLSEASCLFGANLVHDMRGSFPVAIDDALKVAAAARVPCLLVPDTLNESGPCSDTVKEINGSSIIVPDLDGTEGGHIYQLISILNNENVIGGTATTAKPYTTFTRPSLRDVMTIRRRSLTNEAISISDAMVNPKLFLATEYLHEYGFIPLMTGSSLLPYASAEIATRTWRLADINHRRRDRPPGAPNNDNVVAKRYIAKYTANPAIAHGLQHLVGLVSEGLVADLVAWNPKSFGLNPAQVFKGGVPVLTGIATAVSTDQCFIGVSPVTLDKANNYVKNLKLDLRHAIKPIGPPGTRQTMLHHSVPGRLDVDPQTLEISLDGEKIGANYEAAPSTALAHNYA